MTSHFLTTHDVIDETLINRYDEIQVPLFIDTGNSKS
jgi:hypothetical protein